MFDKLLLTLSSNARVVSCQRYGAMNLKCRSYLDRLEFIFTPAPDQPFKKNIPVIPRGLLRGLFPVGHHNYRAMYIEAVCQEDGTYLATVPREEVISYYWVNRTRSSARADDLDENYRTVQA